MGDLNISSTTIGDLKNTGTEFSVDAQSTDGAGDQKETTYTNTRWAVQLGYYKKIPELKASIDALARWTIGKGFSSPTEITEMVLGEIKGFGKDTFNTILENQTRVAKIGGDSFAEIIIDPKNEILANLKPLDPSTIQIVANRQGIIIRYEQIDQDGKVIGDGFKPEIMFHLMRNRVGDNFHGTSMVKALADIIESRNEALKIQRKIMRRFAVPTIIWKLDTDVASEITAFKNKADLVAEHGENFFIPKGAADHELLAVPPNATLNVASWIKDLNNNFFQSAGCPQIIVGNAAEFTDASAKISYLAWQQTIEEEQLYVEEAVLSQLNLVIDLVFPASLEGELLSDKAKDVTTGAAKPSDLIAGRGQ